MIRKMMPSVVGWILAVVAMGAVYVFTASELSVMIIVFLAVLPAVTWLMNYYVRKHIFFTLNSPATSSKGKETVCKISLENKSHLPVFGCYVEIVCENTLTGETSSSVMVLSSAPDGVTDRQFVISSDRCGYVNLSVGRVYLTDIFGVIPLAVKSIAECKCTVLPDTFDINISTDASYTPKTDEEMYSEEKSGNDFSETFQIRDYVPGDSLKQIHWKMSDKFDKLVVREASLPITRSLLVFWDKNTTFSSPDRMDAMAEVVSSVSQALCDEGMMFTLGWTDGEENIFEDITVSEDLFGTTGRMVKSGYAPGISGVRRYMQEKGSMQFGKVIYISGAVDDDIGELISSDIFLMICTDEPVDPQYRSIVFDSDDYLSCLQTLEL